MIRSVAMLGSENSEQLDRDAQILISFIGKVFSWKRELVNAAIDMILGDMMRIALIADYHALASIEMLDKITAEHLVLYELEGRAIEEVYCIKAENYSFSEQQIVKEARNRMSKGYFPCAAAAGTAAYLGRKSCSHHTCFSLGTGAGSGNDSLLSEYC